MGGKQPSLEDGTNPSSSSSSSVDVSSTQKPTPSKVTPDKFKHDPKLGETEILPPPPMLKRNANQGTLPPQPRSNTFPRHFIHSLETPNSSSFDPETIIKGSLKTFLKTADPILLERFWEYIQKCDPALLNVTLAVLPLDEEILGRSSTNPREPAFLHPRAVIDCVLKIRKLHMKRWIDGIMKALEEGGYMRGFLTQDLFQLFLLEADPSVLQRLIAWSRDSRFVMISFPMMRHPLEQLIDWIPSTDQLLYCSKHRDEAIEAVASLLDTYLAKLQHKYMYFQHNQPPMATNSGDENHHVTMTRKQGMMDVMVRMNLVKSQIYELAKIRRSARST